MVVFGRFPRCGCFRPAQAAQEAAQRELEVLREESAKAAKAAEAELADARGEHEAAVARLQQEQEKLQVGPGT